MKVKNFFGMLALLGICIMQACEDDEGDNPNPCPAPSFEIERSDSFNSYTATADFEGMEEVTFNWYINDSLVETENVGSGRDFALRFQGIPNDTVSVCLRINSASCVNEFCEVVFGEIGDTECPDLSFVNRDTINGGLTQTLEADFPQKENTQYRWLIDGIEVDAENIPGEETDHQLIWQFRPGESFEVCIVAEDSCGVREFCETIMAGIPDACPDLFFSTDTISSRSFTFTADFPGMDTLAWYGWFINGEIVEDEGTMNNGDNTLEYVFDSLGVYEVCILTETPECPVGVSYCQTIDVDFCRQMSFTKEKSPDAAEDQHAYLFTANFPDRDAASYEWVLKSNGDVVATETRAPGSQDDHKFFWDFDQNVNYVLCLRQTNAECENFQACEEIFIP